MPYQSTHNYSTNWLHLRNILRAYPIFERNSDIHSLKEHLHANAMAVFLARATLATPVLDRKTVAEVLSGQLKWPTSTNVSHFKGATIPLSFLEENGFVSFYAGWLNVHCCTPKNLESLHPSLVPLIEAINHLKDILYGRNGYIKAHYICKAQDFEESLSNLFGGASAIELLPILHLENGYYHFPPGKENFNPLVSTYLWNEFNKMEPVQAFKNWITCLRVNCESAIPVLFELDKNKERTDFNEQLAAWIANDSALQQTVTVLQKQSQNEQAFQHILSPVLTSINVHININSDKVTDLSDASENIELEKHTLDTLSSAYFLEDVDGLSDLHSVKVSSRSYWREPNLFYTWLLAATVEASIRVDGQMLVSSGYPEAILELAMSRPVLKHMLLNALPSYESAGYKIFLLSKPATCNVALYYLTQRLFLRRNRNDSPAMQLIEKGFSQMVRDEYLRTIEAAQDVGKLLLEIVESLSEEINLRASDFSQSPEYRILIDILDNLNYKHVADLSHSLDNLISQAYEDSSKHPKHHYLYLLGFWLIDRLDNAGIDSTGSLSKSIKDAIFNLYEAEFNDNLTGKCQTLEPSAFFSTLPWHKLFLTDNVGRLLALSNNNNKWNLKTESGEKNLISIASAIRHYLLVLMCVGKPNRIDQGWERVACRVVEIVRMFGFGDEKDVVYLFESYLDIDSYDIWRSFCSYSNVFPEPLFSDFFDRCLHLVPLNQVFTLLEHTTIIGRSRKLQDHIVTRQSSETEVMGLGDLEQAFISACDFEHTALAKKLLHQANTILDKRFGASTHHQVVEKRKLWSVYEYKLTLISEAAKPKNTPDLFAQFANGLAVPFARSSNQYEINDDRHWQECDFFKRYIIAAAYLKSAPERSVAIMEKLCEQSKTQNHSFMHLVAQAAVCQKIGNISNLRRALSQFIDAIGDIKPDQMPNQWAATILDVYKNLKDIPSIDSFWERLSNDQKNRTEMLYPYCKSLLDRGDKLFAKQVLTRYRDHNQEVPDDSRIDELVNELAKSLPDELDMRGFIRDINEQSQRSKVQLTKHYSEIVRSEFPDYVDIVTKGKSMEEFLGDIVLELARELVLRKKNLQLHLGNSDSKRNFRITREDLINDWFTSLFDMRMADARVGFRDQKRGGESNSGDNPGEIDGYITNAKNKRIALFEAFRLFSKDTTVITEHLNKLSGYDNESLSPIFVVAYCDVSDFEGLVIGYSQFVSKAEYDGFNRLSKDGHPIEPLCNTDHIWMGIERRNRGAQQVIFYHLLLNIGG